jgi:hypothetical protein
MSVDSSMLIFGNAANVTNSQNVNCPAKSSDGSQKIFKGFRSIRRQRKLDQSDGIFNMACKISNVLESSHNILERGTFESNLSMPISLANVAGLNDGCLIACATLTTTFPTDGLRREMVPNVTL